VDSEETVKHFADKHGHLGKSVKAYTNSTLRGAKQIQSGEGVCEWLQEAVEMAKAIRLLDRIVDGNLKDVIYWGADFVSYYPEGGRHRPFELIANARDSYAMFFHLWRRGDLRGPAELLLARMINEKLRQSVAPQLVFDDSRQFKEYTRPLSLLGAMWYQMSRAFTGKQSVRRCAECHKWMICERSTKTMHEPCAAKARQRRYRELHDGKEKTRKR
jgi:hypothetical protein